MPVIGSVFRGIAVALAAAMLMGAGPRPVAVLYSLSPEMKDGSIVALDVTVRYAADRTGDGSFEWLRGWGGENRLWQWARDFKVDGAARVEDRGNGQWKITAAPRAPLIVRYRVASAFDHDPTVDDRFNQAMPIIRPTWFYVAGESLFGAPVGRDETPAAFSWRALPSRFTFASDLQHMADPAAPGRKPLRPGTVADIQESISLGGADVRVVGEASKGSGVRVASRGAYRFAAPDFEALTLRIIATERQFWGDGSAPFLVTLAPLAARPGSAQYSGTGRTDAFAIWYDQGMPLESAKSLLAHEFFHTWNARQIGKLNADEPQEPAGYWLSEGFTDYYARRMTLGAGVWTLQDFADAWNDILKSYDLSSQRRTPNKDLIGKYWNDPVLRQLPYWRGSLVAAVLDAKLRVDDPQGLDRLIRSQRQAAMLPHPEPDAATLFRRVLRDRRPDLDAWVEEVVEHGEVVSLPGDAFAPCFTIETRMAPTFERGFDLGATLRNDRKVVGLDPEGPAARAGLKAGDRIGIDESGSDPQVKRRYVVHEPGGNTHVVEYLPQGPLAALQELQVAPSLSLATTAACVRRYGLRLVR
jgi:predicted metalloprotease with PDZ domain